ncbi:alpha/beta fold hydrolase [Paraburkholderia megapolitana]|uniref:Pimeloyl-ACP methyl ester carboxylesterase n=1 Tax=Paraburkholderia megapolitana TaxID=420953 RepID=A0A1I3MLI5_9BURK|nr:alpha/beta hydrolase [Paraburkholderia megapolitana]QDQ84057.1 alpha/beta hydrolase [Paraburkholderia megapolitana]SFI97802.1 Pimeloyl-ACP methyl ester carboxylesterase [Paraburkholderia megapolitana]
MSNTFHRVGTGPHPVMVLHGWFGDCHAFAPMEDALSGDEFSYIFVNYRGYGSRHAVTGAYTMDEIAADTLALASELGFDTFSLIGHSMGGMAIERVAMLAPERVRMLVPVAPVPSCGVTFDDTAQSLFDGAVENIENRKIILDRSTGQRLPRAWINRKAAYSMEHASRAAFAGYLKAWSNTGFSDEAQGLPHRVKVLIGEHDPKFNAELMRSTYLAWYPRAELEILTNAGHYPMDEVPLTLVTSIERFLRQA